MARQGMGAETSEKDARAPHYSGTAKANWNVSAVGLRQQWEEKTEADILGQNRYLLLEKVRSDRGYFQTWNLKNTVSMIALFVA
jgi:hypothetical protein